MDILTCVTSVCPTVLYECYAIYFPHYNLSPVVKKLDVVQHQPSNACQLVLLTTLNVLLSTKLVLDRLELMLVRSPYWQSRQYGEAFCLTVISAVRIITDRILK